MNVEVTILSDYQHDPYHAEPFDAYQDYVARKRSAEEETLAATQIAPTEPEYDWRYWDKCPKAVTQAETMDFWFWILILSVVGIPLVPFVYGYWLWRQHKFTSQEQAIFDMRKPMQMVNYMEGGIPVRVSVTALPDQTSVAAQ